jgi:lysozyme
MNSLNLPDSLQDLLKYYEGLRLKPYRDGNGYWTNGWGHLLTLDRNAPRPAQVDRTQAEAWLRGDTSQTASLVLRCLLARLNPYKLAALIDFTFNLGTGRLKASTLLRKINRGEPDDSILFEFTKWVQPGSVNEKGLKNRRGADIQMWLTGGFDPSTAMDYYRMYRP